MAEKHVRRWLSDSLRRAGAHVTNHEDAYSVGIPDTDYCVNSFAAWIECKWLKSWPKRMQTGVRISFRPGQTPWIMKRIKAGGHAYVLLGVGEGRDMEPLLFSGSHAEVIEDASYTQAELRTLALAVGKDDVIRYLVIWRLDQED